jgi:arabinogalactan oligomer/maltooligosaccharide transport system substrate-binding protein
LASPIGLVENYAEQFVEVAKKGCNCQDGSYIGLPISVVNTALIYNPALLEAAGESLPTTWEEVRGVSEAVVNNLNGGGEEEPDRIYGFYVPPEPYFFYGIQTAYGGDIFRAIEGSVNPIFDTSSSGVILDGSESVDAVNWVAAMIRDGLMPNVDYNTAFERFLNGKIAMMVDGPWELSRLQESGIPFAIANLPSGPVGPARPMVGVDALMISASVQSDQSRTDAAKAFMEFVAQQQNIITLSTGAGVPPALRPDLIENSAFKAFSEAGSEGVFAPDSPLNYFYFGPYATALQNVYQSADPAEALSAAAEEIRSVAQEEGQ